MPTFLLLHGGQHGGWCWRHVEPLLQAAGHRTVAPDLPMDDPKAGARDWARHAAACVGTSDGDLVVVAHSRGGFALPLVPELLPVRRLVGISALLPQPNLRFYDYVQTPDGAHALLIGPSPPRTDVETRGENTTWETYRTYFAHDCPEADARWAWERLRHNATTVYTESPTITAWPATPTTSIVMRDDRAVSPDWSRRVARRIGADVVDLPGGHSPFFADPERLAETLVEVAA